MADFSIQSNFSPAGDQPKAILELVSGYNKGMDFQTLLGITGSGKTFTMANVIEKIQKPTLILSHNKTLAAQLYGEFKALFPNNAVGFFISYYDYYQPEAYMPVTDTYIEKDMSMNEEIDRLRLKATSYLMSRKDVIIIASVSCIYGIGSPDSYKDMLVHISIGDVINVKDMLRQLVNIHYTRNDMVLEPGAFRVRGDMIEIFPFYEDYSIRIELFGDEIEKIYSFDVMTNSKLENFNEFSIFPAKHFVTTRENLNRSMDDIRSELSEQLKLLRSQDKLLEAQRLEQRTLYDLEMMAELGYCSGVENYSMHLDGRSQGERPNTLIDFFPDDYLLFIDESHVSIPQVRAMYNGDRARKDSLITHGFRLPSAYDNRPMKFEEFEKSLNKVIFVSATPAEYELQNSNGVIVEQIIRPTGLLDPVVEVKSTEGQIDYLISEINKTVQNNERVLVTTLTKKMAEDLTDYLRGVGIRSEYMHSEVDTIERINILRGLRMQEFDVLVGINLLREGLDLPEVSLVAVLDADKEGFLRSKSSLLQVSGRAARNINGRVLLFGDKITASMENLIKETNRRRSIQKKYNQENSITPQTITKSLEEVKQSTMIAKESPVGDSIKIDEDNIDGVELNDLLEKLNRKMLACAKKMQFEEAAMLRDKINKIKEGIENDR